MAQSQMRAADLSPQEFRTVVREAVFWGIVSATFFLGLISALLVLALKIITM